MTTTASDPDVAGARLLDEIRDYIRRFWVPPTDAALDAMVLWAVHTHVTDRDNTLMWRTTPRLAFVSDEPGSGKSMGLEMLQLLCARGMLVEDPTGPGLLKAIRTMRPTLLVDEVDLLFGNGSAAKQTRGILNSGYRRGAGVLRADGTADTFAPVALAGLASSFMGNPTLRATRTRCVIIRCAPPAPGCAPERYRERQHEAWGTMLRDVTAKWAAAKAADMVLAMPDMPDELENRALDVWEPLFCVADQAGGRWPARCRAACMELAFGETADEAMDSTPPAVRLARDIQAVWPRSRGEFLADRMATADLIRALSAIEGAPWASMWTVTQMMREIPATIGVQPVKIKLLDGTNRAVQGYYRQQLEPLWTSAVELPEMANA